MSRRTRQQQRDLLAEAGRAYDPERHDPDSIGFDDSYTGPSERSLSGGCNRCGGIDDCYCEPPPSKQHLKDWEGTYAPTFEYTIRCASGNVVTSTSHHYHDLLWLTKLATDSHISSVTITKRARYRGELLTLWVKE